MKNRYKTWLAALAIAATFAAPASAVTVDLLVTYDSYSSNYFNNQPTTAIQSWVNQMNVFNQNSQVDIQWRLVGAEAHEDGGGDMGAVLNNVRTNAWVQQRRDALGADFVVQLHRTGACGVGYVAVDRAWTYSVVGPNCGPNAMAHELGHNMGLNHSRRQGDTTGTRFRYGVGYGVDNVFVDIMAYQQAFGNAPTVPKYSNPNLTCNSLPCGVPIGNDQEAFGAQALNNVKTEIAGFYPSKITSGGNTTTGEWIFCANENGQCIFTGTQTVRYGAGSSWATKSLAWGATCNNATFGDPAPGVAKRCEVTSSWAFCANENGQCGFGGTQTVRYGTGSNFTLKTLSGGAACNNSTFGDPAPGVVKHCDTAQTTWTHCANEGGQCGFSGTKAVLYGANGSFWVKTLTSGAACNNATFGGDPISGVAKKCYIPGV